MAIVVDHESEYKGERKVRDAIAEHFSDDVVIYNNREVNGREYDICLLVKDVCVFIVEVKGWAVYGSRPDDQCRALDKLRAKHCQSYS